VQRGLQSFSFLKQGRRRSLSDEPSDKELLDCARQGDPAAFRTLIRRHDRYLYRVARSVLADDHEAEDIVQQTYLQAFTGLAGFRGAASLRTWLTRITLNEAIRRRRRQRATVSLSEIDTERESSQALLWPSTGLDPERGAARSQIRKVLEAAIDALPSAFRIVLILRDVEEVSAKQAAKALGIKVETVRTRLHRARRMLRERLGEEFAAALKDVFPFELPRCNAMTRRVLAQLGFGHRVWTPGQ
jgi:RNA polymerase sigma-70 factor, ECF subfamily